MRARKGIVAVAAGCMAAGAGQWQVAAQAPVARSSWDGVYTQEQAARGEAAYVAACLSCHGARLDGFDAAPALRGGQFMSTWNGVNLADMLQRMRVTMPLENPGKMSRQQMTDVLAYLLSMNGFPAGEGALPRQSAILRSIWFDAASEAPARTP